PTTDRPPAGLLTVAVDPDACCAMGRCAATAPEVFAQDADTGTVVLLDATPPPALHETARLCADLCPCAAITVTESAAGTESGPAAEAAPPPASPPRTASDQER
ncbi:ferredoxin, partial [Streptomyces sp. URMC 126]|uniref:ferredoxin n=1 Tax=Streptomyces sp. URMC 126 TaxID=3423401 RepID=UPI003F1CD5B0